MKLGRLLEAILNADCAIAFDPFLAIAFDPFLSISFRSKMADSDCDNPSQISSLTLNWT